MASRDHDEGLGSGLAADLEARARRAARGTLDAEHECRHGRIAGDPSEPCGCWPSEHQEEAADA